MLTTIPSFHNVKDGCLFSIGGNFTRLPRQLQGILGNIEDDGSIFGRLGWKFILFTLSFLLSLSLYKK